MKPIKTKADYLKYFDGSGTAKDTKQSEALKYAHDIRQFEVELYWKRAAYFWTFIAAAFAAYFLLFQKGAENADGPRFLVACIGFVFSLAWYLVNRGSKYWQENWERHVDLLEDEVSGPLYKTNLDRETHYSFNDLLGAYPFSVTTINQILSLFTTIVWVLLALQTVGKAWVAQSCMMTLAVLAVTGIATWALLKQGVSKTSGRDFEIRMRMREAKDDRGG